MRSVSTVRAYVVHIKWFWHRNCGDASLNSPVFCRQLHPGGLSWPPSTRHPCLPGTSSHMTLSACFLTDKESSWHTLGHQDTGCLGASNLSLVSHCQFFVLVLDFIHLFCWMCERLIVTSFNSCSGQYCKLLKEKNLYEPKWTFKVDTNIDIWELSKNDDKSADSPFLQCSIKQQKTIKTYHHNSLNSKISWCTSKSIFLVRI